MPVKDIEDQQAKIIGKFPNTYTFSKNLGEKLLKKYRRNIPMVIVRPSMIGAAAEEPFVGWVDSVSATTAVYLAASLGVLKDLHGNAGIIGDQIPVDYWAHLIIASTADIIGNSKLIVYHSGTSSRNPSTGDQTVRYFWPYLGRNPYEKRISDLSFDVYTNKAIYNLVFFIKRRIPAKAFYYFSKILGNEKMKSNSEKFLKALDKWNLIGILYSHFTFIEWIFESYNSFELCSRLSDVDLKTYLIDVKTLNWKTYFPNFSYGIQRFILKEDVEPPFGIRGNFVNKRPQFLSDLMFVYYKGKRQSTRTYNQILKIILNSEKVRIAIRRLAEDDKSNTALSEAKRISIQEEYVNQILDRMASRLDFTKMRMLGYIIHKAYKSMYEKVVVNYEGLERVRALSDKQDYNVIYCPTHRSYVDFLILSYILYAHKIKVPHICAGEDFLSIAIVHTFLRNSGAFFMRRSFKDDLLYKSVFNEYVQLLLSDHHSLEFFVEGTRARSGKMLHPKFGLLNILTNAYFSKKVENLYFVPISINYSRVLEGETFPLELLGESKVKESLGRIVNAAQYVSMNFGAIYVEFAEPISFKSYVQQMVSTQSLDITKVKDQKTITNKIGYELIFKLSENLVIMPPSICASVLLMHRKGITRDELVKQVEFVLNLLKQRNAITPAYWNSAKTWVKKGTYHLNETVGSKKDIIEPRVTPNVDYKNILLLSYYRNNLIHLFINEAFITWSLFGFGFETAWTIGVTIEQLWEKSNLIWRLQRNEFVLTNKFETLSDFEKVLNFMIHNKTLCLNSESRVIIHSEGENTINYLNSLIWPFVDTYWLTFMYIISLVPSKFVAESKIMPKIQSFADSLYQEQIITFYESLSQEIIKNSVSTYQQDGIIVKKKLETITDGVKESSVYTLGDEYNDDYAMQSKLEEIAHFRKPNPINIGNFTTIKKLLTQESPFVAKM